jgi:hypothetical protein
VLGFAIPALAYGGPPVWWDAVLRAVQHLGQLAAAVTVTRAELAGNGTTARIGISLWIFARVCFVAGELLYILARGPSDIAFEAGSFARLIGMVLAGIGVLRSGAGPGPADS